MPKLKKGCEVCGGPLFKGRCLSWRLHAKSFSELKGLKKGFDPKISKAVWKETFYKDNRHTSEVAHWRLFRSYDNKPEVEIWPAR